jgi:acetyltransferase
MCSENHVARFSDSTDEDHGNQFSLRRLKASDRPLLENFLARIDLPDLQMRFFSASRNISSALLELLLPVDQEDRVILVALRHDSEGAPEILAVAQAHPQSRTSAEVALLVRSDLKGMGFGTVIFDRLIAECQRRGIGSLIADVLQHNERMLRLAHRCGFHKQATQYGGAVRLVLDMGRMAA